MITYTSSTRVGFADMQRIRDLLGPYYTKAPRPNEHFVTFRDLDPRLRKFGRARRSGVSASVSAGKLEMIRMKRAGALEDVLIGHVLGSCLVLSSLGALMTLSGAMKHTSYMFVFWVGSALAALGIKIFRRGAETAKGSSNGAKKGRRKMPTAGAGSFDSYGVADTLLIHLPALVVCVHMALFGFLFFLDRISTMGSSMDWHGRAHADMIVGVVGGFLSVLALGPLVPFLAYHSAVSVSAGVTSKSKADLQGTWRCAGKCLAKMLAVALIFVGLSVGLIHLQEHRNSFSAHNPKRVFVQHLHILRGDLGGVDESSFTLLGVDSVPLDNILTEDLRRRVVGPSPMEHLVAAYVTDVFPPPSLSLSSDE